MKHYRGAVLFYFIVFIGLFALEHVTSNMLSRTRDALVKEEKLAATRKNKLENLRSQVALGNADSEIIGQFMDAWLGRVDFFENAETPDVGFIVKDMNEFSVRYDEPLNLQHVIPDKTDKYRVGSRSIQSQRVSATVQGNLVYVLNWLSEMENTYPIARVSKIHIVEYGDSGVEMICDFDFPINLLELKTVGKERSR